MKHDTGQRLWSEIGGNTTSHSFQREGQSFGAVQSIQRECLKKRERKARRRNRQFGFGAVERGLIKATGLRKKKMGILCLPLRSHQATQRVPRVAKRLMEKLEARARRVGKAISMNSFRMPPILIVKFRRHMPSVRVNHH